MRAYKRERRAAIVHTALLKHLILTLALPFFSKAKTAGCLMLINRDLRQVQYLYLYLCCTRPGLELGPVKVNARCNNTLHYLAADQAVARILLLLFLAPTQYFAWMSHTC